VLPLDQAGEGPAVVLLHAGIADRTMWTEQLEWLAGEGHRAIAVDLPGFGEAPVDDIEGAPWLTILGTLSELGIERAAFVGNSFGGAVALRVAVAAPGRVTALGLISAPSHDFEPSPDLEAAWEAEEEALERGDTEAAVQAVVETWTQPDAPPELRERVATMQRRTYAAQAGQPEPAEASDPLDEDPAALGRLGVPTIVAAGEHDLPDFVEAAEQIAAAIPRARHTRIEGAGHLAPLEAPEAFREFVAGLLRESR
jgi:pimeloyl-ACP methyl ester carboxylesterase